MRILFVTETHRELVKGKEVLKNSIKSALFSRNWPFFRKYSKVKVNFFSLNIVLFLFLRRKLQWNKFCILPRTVAVYQVCILTLCSLHLCQAEYSQRYAETNPLAQSLRHLLSEAHLLLRASLLQTAVRPQKTENGQDVCVHTDSDKQRERQELEEALKQNCAQLGDCFSR